MKNQSFFQADLARFGKISTGGYGWIGVSIGLKYAYVYHVLSKQM